jgi:hypothetical protein
MTRLPDELQRGVTVIAYKNTIGYEFGKTILACMK